MSVTAFPQASCSSTREQNAESKVARAQSASLFRSKLKKKGSTKRQQGCSTGLNARRGAASRGDISTPTLLRLIPSKPLHTSTHHAENVTCLMSPTSFKPHGINHVTDQRPKPKEKCPNAHNDFHLQHPKSFDTQQKRSGNF